MMTAQLTATVVGRTCKEVADKAIEWAQQGYVVKSGRQITHWPFFWLKTIIVEMEKPLPGEIMIYVNGQLVGYSNTPIPDGPLSYEQQLTQAIEKEDYERAAELRDQIKNQKPCT
jgi:hypothetical protein